MSRLRFRIIDEGCAYNQREIILQVRRWWGWKEVNSWTYNPAEELGRIKCVNSAKGCLLMTRAAWAPDTIILDDGTRVRGGGQLSLEGGDK